MTVTTSSDTPGDCDALIPDVCGLVLAESGDNCGLSYCSQDAMAGTAFSVAAATAGPLQAWGRNFYGLLGDGTTIDKISPVSIGTASWKAISGGAFHSLGIQADGSLWAWGFNNAGQLGDGTITQRTSPVKIGTASWIAVSAGGTHSLGIQADGSLWAWGFNGNGQLGDGTTTQRTSPVKIGTDSWIAVSAGGTHSLGIQADGSLWAWGSNGSGRLGDGTTTQRTSPVKIGTASWIAVSIGESYSLGIQADGSLWAWGFNLSGQLGDGTNTSRTSPVKIGTASWIAVSTGRSHSLGIQADGSLWAWGSNGSGRLGDGTTTQRTSPVKIGSASWIAVSAGNAHSLGIQADGSRWAWGLNGNGRLGDGTTTQRTSPVQTGTSQLAIAAGADHSLGLSGVATAGPSHGATVTVTATVYDKAGNTATCDVSIELQDDEVPAITCPASMSICNAPMACTATASLTPTVADNCGLTNTVWWVEFADDSTSTGSIAAHDPLTLDYPVGVNTITFTAYDEAGNTAMCSLTLTVEDCEGPTAFCPMTLTTDIDPVPTMSPCADDLSGLAPTVFDNCLGNMQAGLTMTYFLDGPEGTVGPVVVNGLTGLNLERFYLGTTNVLYTIYDTDGNTFSCDFNIIVVDDEPPVAVCTPTTVYLDAAGAASITTAMVDGGSYDRCTGITLTVSPFEFGCTDVLASPVSVTLTATDEYNNTHTCLAEVTVCDNLPPITSCESEITVCLDDMGMTAISG